MPFGNAKVSAWRSASQLSDAENLGIAQHCCRNLSITKLVMLNKKCKTGGVSLKFCEVSPNVMEVFKITKLNKLFDIQSDEEKAVASFDKKGWFG